MSAEVSAVLSRSALHHNLSLVKRLCPSQKIWAMVKANAYGHGLCGVAGELSAADAYGVAALSEALVLRSAYPDCCVVVMRGFMDQSDACMMAKLGIAAVIHTKEQLLMLKGLKLEKPLLVWLKVETGMNRLGLNPDDAVSFLDALSEFPVILQGVMSHFACADDVASTTTNEQICRFDSLLSGRKHLESLANSAAIMQHPTSHRDWVRPGLMLYGVSPFADRVGRDCNLRSVMTLKAPVLAIHYLKKGEKVGYGHVWEAPTDMPIAVVGIGYGDGYPREPGSASILIRGCLCPVVGRVSMDMLTVDLRPLRGQSIEMGELVVIWGEDNPVEKLAETSGTIPYTLLTRVAKRVDYCWES